MNTSEKNQNIVTGVCEDPLAVSNESDRPCPDSAETEKEEAEERAKKAAPCEKCGEKPSKK